MSGFLKKTRRPVVRDIADEALCISLDPPPLNSKQKEVVEKISEKLRADAFFTYLLHGVTDSGKTEVYYHAARAAKKLGKQSNNNGARNRPDCFYGVSFQGPL